jgi:hypothetical protein
MQRDTLNYCPKFHNGDKLWELVIVSTRNFTELVCMCPDTSWGCKKMAGRGNLDWRAILSREWAETELVIWDIIFLITAKKADRFLKKGT